MTEAPGTSREASARLISVMERLKRLDTGSQLPEHDARRVAVRNCGLFIGFSVMLLNILSVPEEGRCTEEDFKKLIGLTTGTVQTAGEVLEKMSRLALVALFQFQVENLFRNLITALGTEVGGEGYYHLVRSLVKSISLGEPDAKLDALDALAHVRNSLHRNGIHWGYKGRSSRICIGGVRFDFVHGEKVSCAGWGHVAVLLAALTSVLEAVLAAPEIVSLTSPVRDEYAHRRSRAGE